MNLIANTGIHFLSIPLELNLNDPFKISFREWFDMVEEKLKLELVHHFADEDVWVLKSDLKRLGYVQSKDEMIDGKLVKAGTVNGKWKEVSERDEFVSGQYKKIIPSQNDAGESDCFHLNINRLRIDKFENCWLPFPFFVLGANKRSQFGPTNWCRIKLVPIEETRTAKKYNLVLAFDTRAKYEADNFEDQDLKETPVFSSEYEASKDFAVCNNEMMFFDFCSSQKNCGWVDDYLLQLYHGVDKLDAIRIKRPKLNYLANYIFLIKSIQRTGAIPTITLFSDKDAEAIDVDIVIDIGNSRTCAVLFDNHDFTRVEKLALQNFTHPILPTGLNVQDDSFDMRLSFHEADLGGLNLVGSKQFVYPSMVRLGREANELIHKAVNLNTGMEKISTFSSPKRYLWDANPQNKEWEYVMLEGTNSKPIWIKGISEYINADGSLNTEGTAEITNNYSRKALMTLAFLEIFAQANMQMNGYSFRHNWGNENKARRLGRIIVTCPTAMSGLEQNVMRKCAEVAALVLNRYLSDKTFSTGADTTFEVVQVIPAPRKRRNTDDEKEWIYDEATSAQFVYLYAEVGNRYRNNPKEFFELYGCKRDDLLDYNKKALTIGSVDIGAGTTDIMIAAYKYGDEGCRLIPSPLYWESFYTAGDDLLKEMVRKLVVQGPNAAIERKLMDSGAADIPKLIMDYFGPDNARQNVTDRQLRSEFNLQVALPVVSRYLQELNTGAEARILSFNDIFSSVPPSERVLNHFKKHFGFNLSEINWKYDPVLLSKIVESTFDALVGKISTVLSYYGCDIVLLSGRPTTLKPLSDLFLKYYAVSPNRLISLNNYRVGTWYPFHDGKGFLSDTKSIVAIGAQIGYLASSNGSLNGFSLDLRELGEKMTATTDYFTSSEFGEPFITPDIHSATIKVNELPIRLWTRQLNSPSYPTRPFYMIQYNQRAIETDLINRLGIPESNKKSLKDAVLTELEKLRRRQPLYFNIVRDLTADKETLKLVSVTDKNNDDLRLSFFDLHVQSMSENENYWMDTGEFTNLNIN